jgi:hypothetical protein
LIIFDILIAYTNHGIFKKEIKMEEKFAFFDDDGTEVNPSLYPKPQLCLSCNKDNDPNEEIVCTLTRMDQRNDKGFKCFGYEET